MTHPGNVVFRHVCKLGLEGIVSKRLGSRYRSGRSTDGSSSPGNTWASVSEFRPLSQPTGVGRCCALATTGHAATLPSRAMNSRRRIGHASSRFMAHRCGARGRGMSTHGERAADSLVDERFSSIDVFGAGRTREVERGPASVSTWQKAFGRR
jgi:hypothetical protein